MDTDQPNSNRPHWPDMMGDVVRCWDAEFVRIEASDAEFACGDGVRPAVPNAVQRKFELVGAIAQTRMVSL